MFVKKLIEPHVKDIATSINKLGVGGKMGNKGGCSVRFKYRESTLAFACCHLESGRSVELEAIRRKQLVSIITNSFIKERGTNMHKYEFKTHEIKVIFGDLNFRST